MKVAYENLPYQHVADSPATKHYANWEVFEEYVARRERASRLGVDAGLLVLRPDVTLSPGTVGVEDEPSWPLPVDTKLPAFHFSNLASSLSLELSGEKLVVAVEKPLEGFYSAHLNVRLRGSSSLILVSLAPPEAAGLSTLSLNVSVEEGSRSRLEVILFDSGSSATALMAVARLGEGSALQESVVAVSGRALYADLKASLRGGGSSLDSSILAVSPREAHASLNTDVAVESPRSSALIRLVGASADGFLAHKGAVKIVRGSVNARGRLSSRLIPLTPSSKVYASPTLEIESDDAEEAQHSASQSPVDPQRIFYLRSRGFTEQEALRLALKAEAFKAFEGRSPNGYVLFYIEEALKAALRSVSAG
ncbi:SufB/SufD family protein [Thermofilum pendens]|uniref:SufBD protein n=1 Tax=Thermofilum pendens (strain DSM 2475 / Hrk 5) TaxID=368408 RepID=A1RZH5_THEPD|nr:SufD family Fe-S cluster assembly protein [Thermofilum pendens]ABL78605.1 SufBD protein [Thermofilum pendens Hrk 5]